MDLKNIQRLKSSLNEITKNKNVLDVILFGSFIKGKLNSNDIDIAIISETGKLNIDLTSSKYQNFHFSIISIENFFLTHISLVNTIFREGYSIKYDKPFSELFKFSSKILFSYELKALKNSDKVRLATIFHGKNGKGLVEENGGEWISRQVFLIPTNCEGLFEDTFNNFNCKYKKSYILIH
ncbi:nucleotidyltransferase domain-containing protein [Candidatus Pacearchaeota archaeon]|nr:nucleotidyltransferase domain-containing protein [Candidatus Pacearchaeota archaeon]